MNEYDDHRRLAVLAVLSACLYGVISWLSPQFEFDSPVVERPIILMLSLFAAAFILYLFAIRSALRAPQDGRLLKLIVWSALLFRALLLPSVPIQEIDIYRYLWDGAVVVQGISPFRYSPEQVSAARASPTADAQLATLARMCDEQPPLAEVLRRIHYGELPTIYPPISQAVFAAATLTTPASAPVPARVFVIKCWFVVFDMATLALVIYLLRLCQRSVGWSIAYAWCPLLLKEVANSGHLDAVAVFLTTLAIVLAVRLLVQLRRSPQSTLRVTAGATLVAICLALAIGAKLYPAVLVPLIGGVLARSLGWRRSLIPAAAFVLVTLLVVWPLLPADPAALARGEPASDQPPIPPSAVHPTLPEASVVGDPSLGIATFLSRWEMNDFIFLIVLENLKPAAEPVDGLAPVTPWFSLLPESLRRRIVSVDSVRVGIDEADVPFALTRAVTLLIFMGLAAWFAWRAAVQADAAGFCEAAFLTIAWFWLLCPTQNPWYWTWALPLLPFARNRAWLAVSGLVLMYYLRFWFSYHWPGAPVWGTGYFGVTFFDFVVTWIEYAPWFVWLAVDSWLSERAICERAKGYLSGKNRRKRADRAD